MVPFFSTARSERHLSDRLASECVPVAPPCNHPGRTGTAARVGDVQAGAGGVARAAVLHLPGIESR
jgi:hypothetical protein